MTYSQLLMKINFNIPFIRTYIVSFILTVFVVYSAPGISADKPTAEYKLKAALLYKLTKFVEWPKESENSSQRPFGLCVLGNNNFGSALDSVEGRTVGGRKIALYFYDQSEAMQNNCDLVFISDSKRPFLSPILLSLNNQAILSVSDMSDFAKNGGIIQFTTRKRIGFKINIESAKKAGLKIAAPLLQLATIVKSKD